jgi:hypothetical protein
VTAKLAAMFEKLTGRKPTAQEMEAARPDDALLMRTELAPQP